MLFFVLFGFFNRRGCFWGLFLCIDSWLGLMYSSCLKVVGCYLYSCCESMWRFFILVFWLLLILFYLWWLWSGLVNEFLLVLRLFLSGWLVCDWLWMVWCCCWGGYVLVVLWWCLMLMFVGLWFGGGFLFCWWFWRIVVLLWLVGDGCWGRWFWSVCVFLFLNEVGRMFCRWWCFLMGIWVCLFFVWGYVVFV